MSPSVIASCILLLMCVGWVVGTRRVLALANGSRRPLHSIPLYHGLYAAILACVPALLLLLVLLSLEGFVVDLLLERSLPDTLLEQSNQPLGLLLVEIKNIAAGQAFGEPSEAERQAADHYVWLRQVADWTIAGAVLTCSVAGFIHGWVSIRPDLRARDRVEAVVRWLLMACALIAILTTLGIFLSIITEAVRFFGRVPLTEFLTDLNWKPSSAIRAGQTVSSAEFGLIPVLAGTLMITGIALLIGVPIGIFAALYLAEYAPPRIRALGKPLIEVLSGIPTVVYGFFAALTVAPFIASFGGLLGMNVSQQSALAAGSVMGIMIIPFVSSLSEDVVSSVPGKLRQAAYAMGATHGEAVRLVVLPAALPGMVGAVILAFSVAVGETMIVLMAAGLFANLTANPLEPVTTMTVQIANILTGDQSFDSATTLSAYALALVLFVLTLGANLLALSIMDKYRVKYG